jgi:hypothetical protein
MQEREVLTIAKETDEAIPLERLITGISVDSNAT